MQAIVMVKGWYGPMWGNLNSRIGGPLLKAHSQMKQSFLFISGKSCCNWFDMSCSCFLYVSRHYSPCLSSGTPTPGSRLTLKFIRLLRPAALCRCCCRSWGANPTHYTILVACYTFWYASCLSNPHQAKRLSRSCGRRMSLPKSFMGASAAGVARESH